MHRVRELLYQERSVHHLDFSPMKGILCVPRYSLIAFEMISLSWQLSRYVGSTEISIFET